MRNVRSVTFEIGCQPKSVELEGMPTNAEGESYVGEFGIIIHSEGSDEDVLDVDADVAASYGGEGDEGEQPGYVEPEMMDLSDIELACTDPPMQSDDEVNAEHEQCQEMLGGSQFRLINAWDCNGRR